ncbi:MAG TPA: metal-dependent hydrolase [Candidatus Paceibacterota bacterium]|nr:metal-dependent hydrolase [Candidatus Paceibacterota bacterium]
MLPPGHVAGGYLLTQALLSGFRPPFTHSQQQTLLWLGTFFAFAPDLDYFVLFAKTHSMTPHDLGPHRAFWSHRPFVWLVLAALVVLIAPSPFMLWVALLVWLGSWSHFVLDTIQEPGIMWLWPFSRKLFTLRKRPTAEWNQPEGHFLRYWARLVAWYARAEALSFWSEFALVCAALVVLLRHL